MPAPNRILDSRAQMKPAFGTERKTAPALARVLGRMKQSGQVAEWSKAADCKSADPCGLRRFEPSPVHQFGVRNSKLEIRNSDDNENSEREASFEIQISSFEEGRE